MDQPGLFAFPMHGQHKLSNEGYRTRDGHLIEWFGRTLNDTGGGPVLVVSRPEPKAMARVRGFSSDSVASNTTPIVTHSWRLPTIRDRQRWWVDSLPAYHKALPPVTAPVITWNPFLALSSAWPAIVDSGMPVVFDLLDDWAIHYAFGGVRREVMEAYRVLFDHATVVTANAEGTVDLARRFGRDDVVFIPNGCDPERFSSRSLASGPITVGYVGKIGKRLNLELILETARTLPDMRFVFAGPVLDAEYRRPMMQQENITMLGDVHYDDVPALLQTFDIGWVPHRVGEGEVGGDVIKTYEYRAAGLPVLTTPVAGASKRGLTNVSVVPADQQVTWLREACKGKRRVAREVTPLPADVTWRNKSEWILKLASGRPSGPNQAGPES